ncbi:hypothetical protein MN116_000938 [Schistosoma mekongi]|uniref:Glucose-methanol-choline oxidoreductase N-terminal domain-containing protein n=1 Tax=Schistosoma mekongi TaxID=38744 RepID=A0AAE1ZK82_SCHME|nr:hypothetical protein MN116_000938 [Schistosoma mekongi]
MNIMSINTFGGGTSGSIIVRKLWDGFQKMQCIKPMKARSCSLSNRNLYDINDNENTCKAVCTNYRPKILLLESGPKISWLTKKISDIPLLAPLLFGRGIDSIDRTTSQSSSAFQLKENVILLPRGHVLGGTALLNAMIFSFGHPDDEVLKEFLQHDQEFLSELYNGDKIRGCSLKPEMIHHLAYNHLIHEYFEKAFELQGLKPEILLSAGAIKTPEILLNSGLGPTRNYSTFNQEYKHISLPVGENLHDHPMIGLICSVINGTTLTKKSLSLLEIFKYYWHGQGILSQASALTSIGYYRTSYQKVANDSRPDIQYTVIAASPFEKDTFENLGNLNPSAWRQYMKDEDSRDFENPMILLITLLNPRSRGSVTINYNHIGQPTGNVKINPAYLCDLTDAHRLVEGVIWIYKAIQSVNQKLDNLNKVQINKGQPKIAVKLHFPHFSGCPKIPKSASLQSFEQDIFVAKLKTAIECLIKSLTLSNYHLVGTCAMKLPCNNTSAVVDTNFKIIGFKNIRIGDASVISKIPTGTPSALIMAIGNQLAKYIIHENWEQLQLVMN